MNIEFGSAIVVDVQISCNCHSLDKRKPMFDFSLFGHPLAGTPMGTALDLCIVLAALIWILSVVTREYSWIDRSWSICPLLYCLIVAASVNFQSPRVALMTALVGLWSVRLTFNFARKGGYWRGGEDYRWAVVKERMGPIGFQALNITFVAPGQMLIIWLFTSPIHLAWLEQGEPLGVLDLVAAALFFVFFVGETVADEQMWRFQEDKKKRLAAGEQPLEPFLRHGLYHYCRHPNYLCEMALWCSFYLFGVAASGIWFHWTGLGCIALIALFAGSIPLTETISSSKYPDYETYKQSTPMLIPFVKINRSNAKS